MSPFFQNIVVRFTLHLTHILSSSVRVFSVVSYHRADTGDGSATVHLIWIVRTVPWCRKDSTHQYRSIGEFPYPVKPYYTIVSSKPLGSNSVLFTIRLTLSLGRSISLPGGHRGRFCYCPLTWIVRTVPGVATVTGTPQPSLCHFERSREISFPQPPADTGDGSATVHIAWIVRTVPWCRPSHLFHSIGELHFSKNLKLQYFPKT